MKRTLLAVPLFVLAAAATAVVQAQSPPSISLTTPSAVRPGQATDLTFHGGNLAGARALWLSFPAEIALSPDVENNGQDAAKVTYRITLPDDAPLGIGGVRVVTAGGVSAPRLLMVDDLPTITDNGQNKSTESAQELTLPVAVDGACEAESYDYYQFTATTGQRITVEVVARRLGSPLDPVIRLLDASGRELAYSDDEGGIGADSRFAYQFEADGTYFLEVRDIRYHGSGNHRYRLRIGDFPLVTVPVPLGGQQGTMPKVGFAGPAVAGVPRRDVIVPSGDATRHWLSVAYPDGRGSAFTTLVASASREAIEFEPNDAPEQASPVQLPAAISGRLEANRDRDWYQFDASAGQRYRFIGQTRQLGSPTDLFIRLYKADGSRLAEVDDAPGNEEGILDVTFPEDGTYRLMIEDLHRRGGPEFAYRIAVEPYQPGFTLAVEGNTFNAPQGGVFVAKVTSARRDYAGPITLSIEGAGDGFRLANHVIAENQNETVLNVTVPSSLEQGAWSTMRIVGTAKIGETDVRAAASSLGTLRGQFSGLPYPPDELAETLALGIGPPFADFFKIELAGGAVEFPQLIGSTTFEVKAERMNKFEEAIALAVEGLPAGFSAEAKPIEKGQGAVAVTLTGPGTLAEGTYRFRVRGNATFQNQPKQVVLNDLPLRVIKPLKVAGETAEPLTAGGKQTVKVRLTRFGEEKPAVAIAFENLPLGVSAPADLVIPEGTDELDVELTAAENAMLGNAAGATVVAQTQLQGRDITVEGPLALDVQMP